MERRGLEVNMATSELRLEAYGEASAVELLHAEKAVPLPCPAEEAVPLSSPVEEAVPLPCPAEAATLSSSPAEDAAQPPSPAGDAAQRSRGAQRSHATGGGVQRSSAARGGALTFNPGGGGAPPICCPAEAASFSVAARDSSHRGAGLPLQRGFWRSESGAFGGGFCYATASRWHCGTASDWSRNFVLVRSLPT
ncbi:skin secretory protein xP2 isoform X3 [Ictalurus punctatus]|uniref:Skin secretory protein xP2 isoform X3 n=1 Tax=Ictalurus punctatus TaxID=7998 RepID=A0A9F7TGN7_ICTPU|nr:skin secretory protein xP2 isoform X3 [Ictalurus punctatus]XP_053532186.1 skin secretory protein xP2 isoform X3 [Ictalurus punctatus]